MKYLLILSIILSFLTIIIRSQNVVQLTAATPVYFNITGNNYLDLSFDFSGFRNSQQDFAIEVSRENGGDVFLYLSVQRPSPRSGTYSYNWAVMDGNLNAIAIPRSLITSDFIYASVFAESDSTVRILCDVISVYQTITIGQSVTADINPQGEQFFQFQITDALVQPLHLSLTQNNIGADRVYLFGGDTNLLPSIASSNFSTINLNFALASINLNNPRPGWYFLMVLGGRFLPTSFTLSLATGLVTNVATSDDFGYFGYGMLIAAAAFVGLTIVSLLLICIFYRRNKHTGNNKGYNVLVNE